MTRTRIWSFTNLEHKYSGYYVKDFYRALYRAAIDQGFSMSEWLQAKGVYEGGSEAVVSRWVATRESEGKYALNCLHITSKIIWKNVPKPGTPADVENPPLVPKGTVDITLNGFIVLDFLNVWGGAPLLRPFSGIRDNILRRRMKGNLILANRKEGESIIKSLKEFASFLPNIK